jgi:hypothetical protein
MHVQSCWVCLSSKQNRASRGSCPQTDVLSGAICRIVNTFAQPVKMDGRRIEKYKREHLYLALVMIFITVLLVHSIDQRTRVYTLGDFQYLAQREAFLMSLYTFG